MVGKYWINTPCYFNMVSFTGSNNSDTWAGNEQVIVLQLGGEMAIKQHATVIKQQSWPMSQVHGYVPIVFNMGIY